MRAYDPTVVPTKGCWVQALTAPVRLGLVVDQRRSNGRWEIKVHWGEGEPSWLPVDRLGCGFQPGWEVQDLPLSATRKSLGRARVEAVRRLANREQVLVQVADTGRSAWLPYENLVRVKTIAHQYERAETKEEHHADRCRLRMLAHALESWNEATGALDRLDVDPLPHQIHLVHRVLSSNNLNWLIADDVGLGKTIEVGLILNGLGQRKARLRVLIITPAGLVRQWQDELKYKFGQTYEIYGRDFAINDSELWRLHDRVIASIDVAKREDHLPGFRDSGPWDIIVVDEAHRLTRDAKGYRSQRYRLAEVLRGLSDALLLLTGTPHQGKSDRFVALLKLARPDLADQLDFLEAQPEIVGEIILRNRKATVTDLDGRFIFHGQRIQRVAVPVSSEMQAFIKLLDEYLRRGYRAGALRGDAGRAIGFVMTVYRKLASSSIAAIKRALELRRARLAHEIDEPVVQSAADSLELFEGGDDQDNLVESIEGTSTTSFFVDELHLIDELLDSAARAVTNDHKLAYLERLLDEIVAQAKNVVIFTEYRASQSYLQGALAKRYPTLPKPHFINGSMTLDEKLANIEAFNVAGRFLISTEAGGEGLNLHTNCHVLINYDLPWNPSRLVQRIGRLYRYGQAHPVIALNLHANDSFDSKVLNLMYTRVEQIARDMAPVGTEFNDRLHAEILGELLEHLDVADILGQPRAEGLERTREEIEQAIAKAKQAQMLESELLAYANGFDPNALKGTLGLTTAHAQEFVEGVLPLVGAAILHRSHGARVVELRLPDDFVGRFSELGQHQIVKLTCDRRVAQELRQVRLMDFASPFFRHLIEQAKAHEFGGFYGCRSADPEGTLAAFRLRWQNDQGDPTSDEFVTIFRGSDGQIEVNPAFLIEYLTELAKQHQPFGNSAEQRFAVVEALQSHAELLLAQRQSRFRHPNDVVLLAAADLVTPGE